MRINIKYLGWVFLGFYITIVIALLAMPYTSALCISSLPLSWRPFLFPFDLLKGNLFWTTMVLSITAASQAVFIFGAGTVNLCRPIRRRRLLVPVAIAALMMAILVVACCIALAELFEIDASQDSSPWVFWTLISISWIGWGVVFFLYGRKERYHAIRKIVLTLLGGSLLELMVAIPSYVIVRGRPGCLVGLGTALGIASSFVVMLWSFGPGIILLFLSERRRNELKRGIQPTDSLHSQ